MTIYERRKAHLDSRLKVYLDDPKQRAISPISGKCMYRTEDGKKCFIGVDIPEEAYNAAQLEPFGVSWMDTGTINKVLPDNIRELDGRFLAACQALHDNSHNWCATGLTSLGLEVYNNIVTNHCTAS